MENLVFKQSKILSPSLADLSKKEDIYKFQTKNHLNCSPSRNIRKCQEKDIPVFLTRLIDPEKFSKDLFWITTSSEDKDKIVGTIGLSIDKDDPTSAEINTFSVDQDYRNRGIGTELIKYCLSKVKDYNLKRLYLVTTNYMTSAVSLYQKFGFKVYKELLIKIEDGVSKLTDDIEEFKKCPEDSRFKATFFELFLDQKEDEEIVF